MKTPENRVRIGQRWDPELLKRAQAAADELGQTLTTFTERALAAHLATLERRESRPESAQPEKHEGAEPIAPKRKRRNG